MYIGIYIHTYISMNTSEKKTKRNPTIFKGKMTARISLCPQEHKSGWSEFAVSLETGKSVPGGLAHAVALCRGRRRDKAIFSTPLAAGGEVPGPGGSLDPAVGGISRDWIWPEFHSLGSGVSRGSQARAVTIQEGSSHTSPCTLLLHWTMSFLEWDTPLQENICQKARQQVFSRK